jgi:DNA (cytosine-5)-methyltransferase 1
MSDRPLSLTRVQIRVLDLFSGCGGLSAGLRATGRFTVVGAVESDRNAAETYRMNFGDHVHHRLIEDVRDFPVADVVVGGPPCQGFSPLNRDGVGFERRALWEQYLRALDAASPRMFLMENVPQLLESAEYQAFRRAAIERGYVLDGRVLNTADFGVPQRRRRAFVLGSLDGPVAWPSPTHANPSGPLAGRAPWMTFADAVVGLPLEPDGVNWHRARNPRPESIVRYKAVPHDGGDRFEMQRNLDAQGLGHLVPRCWRNKPTGTTDVFGRLWWDRPALTIRTEFFKPEKGRYLHPSADRPITLREAARCMSFDDDFRFPETQSMTSVARQIGNAVPPVMARVLGVTIARHLSGSRTLAAA